MGDGSKERDGLLEEGGAVEVVVVVRGEDIAGTVLRVRESRL